MNKQSESPLVRQYKAIREKLPAEIILAFRLGDFYEFFFQDANDAAKLLNLTLTNRRDIPMAGVPYHSADAYFAKIVAAGRKVAIAELQPEGPPVIKY